MSSFCSFLSLNLDLGRKPLRRNFLGEASQLLFQCFVGCVLCKHVFYYILSFLTLCFPCLRICRLAIRSTPTTTQTCLGSCSRSFTGAFMQAIPHRKYLCFSSTLRAEQRHADTPWTCSDASPVHLRLHQSHTCVPSHLCHVVVNLHPDMIRARLVVLLVSFRVSYVWGESLTLCRHGKD